MARRTTKGSFRKEIIKAALSSTIRVFATDVDGTLTDGGMYYTEAGEMMKRFNTRDAFGMRCLADLGVILVMISSEDSPIVLARANKLRIQHIYTGVQDKERLMDKLLKELGLNWDQLAFVGDDLNDLGILKRAGFSACPCDAAPEVTKSVDYVCHTAGGYGAVREACDLIKKSFDNHHQKTKS